MTTNEFMNEIELIIEDAKTGILATVDKDGSPHMRWMTPTVLRGRPGAIYAVTSKRFNKAKQLEHNPKGEWMLQTRLLDKVVSAKGKVNIVDNSSLKNEVIEAIGPRLNVFWSLNKNTDDLVVLETVLEEGSLFSPMKQERTTVHFEV